MAVQPGGIAIPNMAGKVLTVKGPIEPDQLGVTLHHEHLFLDLRKTHLPYRTWVVKDDKLVAEDANEDYPADEMEQWEAKVDLSNVYRVRGTKPLAVAPIADNYFLSDEKVAIQEVMEFKKVGGNSIAEVSSMGLKRAPLALRRVSEATGVNIIAGTGHYQRVYHPDDMDERTVEDITDAIIRDVVVGIDDGVNKTDIRSGIVGEIGINGGPLITNELKSMRAAARASRLTGAPIMIHLGGVGNEKHTILDICEDEGVGLDHVILAHCDGSAYDVPFVLGLLERGIYAAFDNLGREPEVVVTSRTAVIAEAIPKLIDAGYEDRILISHDVCWKSSMKAYGWFGFTFIHSDFLPQLREYGVTEEQIDKIMVQNPKRIFTFVEPRE